MTKRDRSTARSTGTIRAAVYARVSTTDQNCEMQLRELRDYCHGIMKARWTAQDYTDMAWKPLSFTQSDIDLIQSGLTKRVASGVILEAATQIADVDSVN